MRTLPRLLGASLVLLSTLSLEPPVVEAGPTTCTDTCSSGATLQCCLASGNCTGGSGSIDCNGTLLTCGPIDAYNTCRNYCEAERDYCSADCNFERSCYYDNCRPLYWDCLESCGWRPTTNIGC